MANDKNLENGKATQFRSGEEAARNGQNGGRASGAARRRRKRLRDAADYYLSLPVSDKKTVSRLAKRGIDAEEMDNQMLMIAGLTDAASCGDAKAGKLIFDLIGSDDREISDGFGHIDATKLFSSIAPAFLATHQQIISGKLSEVVEKGGRGSAKSSFMSIEVLSLLDQHKDCHAVCIRRYANTLRTSVYAQMQWAVDALGLSDQYDCTVSPMAITHKVTGQKILFFGLDDPSKLKSIKLPFGYIGVLWFEELDQFSGPEEVRNVEQSCLRGGEFSFTLKSFNPPATARNWANQYALEAKSGKLVQHSDYRNVPEEWLGRRFLDDAAHLKETNETAYRHEYLGEITGSGRAVFENLELRQISPSEIAQFDRKLHGIDWGWYPDPWAYNATYYDAGRKTLYVFDELTRRRTSNKDTAQLLIDRGVCQDPDADEILTADSAEEKSCDDYRAFGLPCRGAQKGPGSVRAGMQWLQSLHKIVIDPSRCPDTAKEFSEYEYDLDPKTNEVLPGYPDHSNHHIDAIRYATNRIWKRRGQ